MKKDKLSPKYPCRAKNPLECPYHGTFIKLEQATTYDEYENAKATVLKAQRKADKFKTKEFPEILNQKQDIKGLIKPPRYLMSEIKDEKTFKSLADSIVKTSLDSEVARKYPQIVETLNQLQAEFIHTKPSKGQYPLYALEYSQALMDLNTLQDTSSERVQFMLNANMVNAYTNYHEWIKHYSPALGWRSGKAVLESAKALAHFNVSLKLLNAIKTSTPS